MKKILLNRESSIAYRKGFKCRTQRVMKSQPDSDTGFLHQSKDETWFERNVGVSIYSSRYGKCPYGKVGDRIQLLTSWAVPREYDDYKPSDLLGSNLHCEDIWTYFDSDQKPDSLGRSRSPLFMPGWLRDVMPQPKIVSIEARRVNDITEEECTEEGIRRVTKDGDVFKYCIYDKGDYSSVPWQDMPKTAKECYTYWWNRINSKRGYPWELNPWVWNIQIENWNDLK